MPKMTNEFKAEIKYAIEKVLIQDPMIFDLNKQSDEAVTKAVTEHLAEFNKVAATLPEAFKEQFSQVVNGARVYYGNWYSELKFDTPTLVPSNWRGGLKMVTITAGNEVQMNDAFEQAINLQESKQVLIKEALKSLPAIVNLLDSCTTTQQFQVLIPEYAHLVESVLKGLGVRSVHKTMTFDQAFLNLNCSDKRGVIYEFIKNKREENPDIVNITREYREAFLNGAAERYGFMKGLPEGVAPQVSSLGLYWSNCGQVEIISFTEPINLPWLLVKDARDGINSKGVLTIRLDKLESSKHSENPELAWLYFLLVPFHTKLREAYNATVGFLDIGYGAISKGNIDLALRVKPELKPLLLEFYGLTEAKEETTSGLDGI